MTFPHLNTIFSQIIIPTKYAKKPTKLDKNELVSMKTIGDNTHASLGWSQHVNRIIIMYDTNVLEVTQIRPQKNGRCFRRLVMRP